MHLVSADPEMVPALQQAHGLAALITLVRHDATHPELAAAARQVPTHTWQGCRVPQGRRVACS